MSWKKIAQRSPPIDVLRENHCQSVLWITSEVDRIRDVSTGFHSGVPLVRKSGVLMRSVKCLIVTFNEAAEALWINATNQAFELSIYKLPNIKKKKCWKVSIGD